MEERYFAFIFTILTIFQLGYSLECYVCKNQEDNMEKCIKTLKTCEHYEDMCMTEISWGTTPYWQAGALKQYYISKSCSTAHQCNRTITKLMPQCTHIWYEDWKCADCCQGDRCNYYIISGVGRMETVGLLVFVASIAAVMLGQRFI